MEVKGGRKIFEWRADRKSDGGGGVVVEAASPSLSVSSNKERPERGNL